MRLTRRERQILEGLRRGEDDLEYDGDNDLAEGGGEVWFGAQRTNHQLLYSLLRNALISKHEDSGMDTSYYRINGWGRLALKDPDFDPQSRMLKCMAAAELAAMEMEESPVFPDST